ncbi:hypothetical protein T440DRAFT_470759 [Plenodomus tracheiphilus IPT5]|uniref:J domain-containing protein n=1 Tax=Plenodomus tracheiphilus IPT5 TaxID=1408161 RepID=A0A6A7AWM7_9PLEO|nr:hypothetical protein T440DRAFT_470759 [Plenodomus tracheiphilus IPT5]
MLQSYSALPHVPQMCSISPLRTKRRVDHERHASEVLQRPRPISVSSHPAMQHTKRASIYVSDASIILAQRTPMVSPTSPQDALLSPSNETLDVDHYAILELDPQASTDDIKAAYRRLRVVYFQSDAKKYRALQAAFDTLLDPEARQTYDASHALRATTLEAMETKHERKDSVTGTDGGIATVLEEEDEDVEAARCQDSNWALKRHQRLYAPLIGTQPYWSHIPISISYGSRSSKQLGCRRPAYVGHSATMALPN